ncbi:MAG: FHA domain-containing protein [Gammaproteobacteria bacterium]|nr:FHA domain-containing protein [Gammaproteobacteria bacterium]
MRSSAMSTYTPWFKLAHAPFRLRPEPELLFLGGEFGRAVQRLRALIDGGSALMLLTGTAGSGKSTVLRALADQPGAAQSVVRVWQPDLPPPRLLELLHEQLGLPRRQGEAADSLDLLARHLASESAGGRRVLILLDDAHELAPPTLSQLLRLLALDPAPMLLLAGEPPVRAALDGRPQERAAAVPAVVELPGLNSAETSAYVRERLRRAGAGAEIFEPAALDDVHAYAEGVPALINVLCDAAMGQTAARFGPVVNAQDVRDAARALHWIGDAAPEPQPLPPAAITDTAIDVSGALLLVARRGRPMGRFPLPSTSSLLVGRTADCDLQLDGSFVSRRHCRVMTLEGHSVVEDLGSTNGIAVNGGRHLRGLRHALANGDEVRIGDYTLTYVLAESQGGSAAQSHG